MAGRFFHFTYHFKPHYPLHNKEKTACWDRTLHLVRDSMAFVEYTETIYKCGYTWGDTILNLFWEKKYGPEATLTDQPEFDPDDLIVVTTRCPLDDDETSGRRRILRSNSLLENTILNTVRNCFLERSLRGEVTLKHALREARKREGYPAGTFKFSERNGVAHPVNKLVGFLAFAPHLLEPGTLKPTGPKLLVSFAVGGVENVIWARALRTSHADLLSEIIKSKDQYWAVVGPWEPKSPPPRPGTFKFADGMKLALEVMCAAVPDDKDSWRCLPYKKIKEPHSNKMAWQLV
jgi:hypothetical protein